MRAPGSIDRQSPSPLDPQVSRGVCVAALALCALAASVTAVAVGEPSYLIASNDKFAAIRFADNSDEGKVYTFGESLPQEFSTLSYGIDFVQIFGNTFNGYGGAW